MSSFNLVQIVPSLDSGGVERGTVDVANFLAEKNIDELQKYSCVFPEEKEISNKIFYKKYGRDPYNLSELKQIGIYAFGAEKGHPLLQNILDEITCRYYDYKSEDIV